MGEYAKDIRCVLEECERALQAIQGCVAYDGTTCAPNNADMEMVRTARASIHEYCELRDIKLSTTHG